MGKHILQLENEALFFLTRFLLQYKYNESHEEICINGFLKPERMCNTHIILTEQLGLHM